MRLSIYKLLLSSLLCFSILCLFVYFHFLKSNTIEYIPKNYIAYEIAPNCKELFLHDTDPVTLYAAEKWKTPPNELVSDSKLYKNIDQNCNLFFENQKYFFGKPISNEESFPIAFTIVAYENAFQVERLLRTIYRPWNYYCIHIDKKSYSGYVKAIKKLVNCLNSKFNNTIISNDRVNVKWSKMSVLTADLSCMNKLLYRYKKWKYLINLTGQDFPLKTNAELVSTLKLYEGANNIEGTYKNRTEDQVPTIKMPIPIVWYKGAVHITVNRDFVKFIFESPKSRIILKALQGSSFPEDQFFSTLNYNVNLRIPGSYIGDPDDKDPSYLTRFKILGDYKLCKSRYFVENICIWGVGDLPKLVRAPHLFAHKFYDDFQPATMMCLEKWYREKVDKEIATARVLVNKSFYASLPFIKYRYQAPVL